MLEENDFKAELNILMGAPESYGCFAMRSRGSVYGRIGDDKGVMYEQLQEVQAVSCRR